MNNIWADTNTAADLLADVFQAALPTSPKRNTLSGKNWAVLHGYRSVFGSTMILF